MQEATQFKGEARGCKAVAGDVSLSPAWWPMLLFCPLLASSLSTESKQWPDTTRAGVFSVCFFFFNEASRCYCIKSKKLQNFRLERYAQAML